MEREPNRNDFLIGLLTGLFLQWANIIPVMGAFALGLSIRKLPDMIDLSQIPVIAHYFGSYMLHRTPSTDSKDPNEPQKVNIKKK